MLKNPVLFEKITAFVKTTIRENEIPFALKAADDPFIYSEENLKYLRQAIAQIEDKPPLSLVDRIRIIISSLYTMYIVFL